MLEQFITWILKWRWIFIGIMLLTLGGLSPFIQKALVPDNSLTIWFLSDDPLLKSYEEFHQRFGNDEIVLLKLDSEENVFQKSYLKWLDGLIREIETVDGVFQVHSILSVQDAFESADGLDFDNLIPSLDLDQEKLKSIFEDARNNPLIVGKLFHESGKQCMLWIELEVRDDYDEKRGEIVHSITDVAESYAKDKRIALGGLSVIYTALNDISQREVSIFFGLCFFLIFLMLIWIFRQWRLIAATIGVIIFGTSIALGAYGLLGHQLNLLTVMLPTLIIILGVADAVHFPATFVRIKQEFPELSALDLTVRSLCLVFWPCLLTTLTTVCGFLSLTSSPMAIIRDYGLYTAVGLVAAFLACFVFMGSAFIGIKSVRLPCVKITSVLVHFCKNVLFQHPILLGVFFVFLTLGALFGALRIKVDTYTLGYLSESTRVVQDHNYITNTWGAYANVECMIRIQEGQRIDSPNVLNSLELFVNKVEGIPEIHQGFALPLLYRRMEAVITGSPRSTLPLDESKIEQLNLLLEGEFLVWDKEDPEFKDNVLQPFTTEDKQLGRITFIAEILSARKIARVTAKMEQIAKETFGSGVQYELAGYTPLYVTIIDYVMSSQIRSFFLIIIILFSIILFWTRSFPLAFLSLIPNLLPVTLILGVMGYLGIALDIGTAVVAAIVIGVAIDDTIHFVHYWREGMKQGLSWKDNVEYTFNHAGRAIIITTLLLLVGFPLMMLSQLRSVFYFGLLTTIAAIGALLADLLLLPLLLKIQARGSNRG